jgi:hypothetical protein
MIRRAEPALLLLLVLPILISTQDIAAASQRASAIYSLEKSGLTSVEARVTVQPAAAPRILLIVLPFHIDEITSSRSNVFGQSNRDHFSVLTVFVPQGTQEMSFVCKLRLVANETETARVAGYGLGSALIVPQIRDAILEQLASLGIKELQYVEVIHKFDSVSARVEAGFTLVERGRDVLLRETAVVPLTVNPQTGTMS